MFTLAYEAAQIKAGHTLKIEAMHARRSDGSPHSVEFYSYLESFSENFNSNWNEEDVFGRMDGIVNFINTKRTISLSFRVPAAHWNQAKQNAHKISQLVRFLYPGIEDGQFGNIKTAPIIRLRFGNIIQDTATRGGLFGFIQGAVNIVPVKDAGYFTPIQSVLLPDGTSSPKGAKRDESTNIQVNSTIVPKVYEITFTFRPLHNHLLGYRGSEEAYSEFANEAFPYGFHRREFESENSIQVQDNTPQFGENTILNGQGTEGNPDYQSILADVGLSIEELNKLLYGFNDPKNQQSVFDKVFKSRK